MLARGEKLNLAIFLYNTLARTLTNFSWQKFPARLVQGWFGLDCVVSAKAKG